MKKLYFIRHGESEGNVQHLFTGRWDVPLTQTGCQQAQAAGLNAKTLGINCIVASPLIRAAKTAQIIAVEINFPADKIIYSNLFMERDYGDLQGQPYEKMPQDFDNYRILRKRPNSKLELRPLIHF